MEKGFIWLPSDKYPLSQTTFYNALAWGDGNSYTVCKLKKRYNLEKTPKTVVLEATADTAFLLTLNGRDIMRGPAYSGGDFLDNDKPRGDYYSYKTELSVTESYLDFSAIVRLMPLHICEYSKGQGGFFLSATVIFEGGEEIELFSNSSWEIKRLNSYTSARFFDSRLDSEPWVFAEQKPDIWHPEVAPVPPCTLKNLKTHTFAFSGGEVIKERIEYDRVYAGYLKVRASAASKIKIRSFELEAITTKYDLSFVAPDTYYSLELLSSGGLEIEIEGIESGTVDIVFDESFFPIYECAKTELSDKELSELLDISAHTLKYCRQGHHLDSPLHCEPLACVGDYYIEMLMTEFSYRDTSLCEFDLVRIAKTMEARGGRLFHTTYSLIWVKMLYECYMLSGNIDLLKKCKRALDLLLSLFKTYIGENGIIETPPDYMFVDWLFPDGISTHHPPKALGQSCLNMFYFGALENAAKIYSVLGCDKVSEELKNDASKLREAIIHILYDKERGLFFEGLNTETPSELIYQYMPKNVEKRYYRRHANILACYFGIFKGKEAEELLDKIYYDHELGEVQPYFMHFWLGAVYNAGLREKYTLSLLSGWKEALRKCTKGLPEGFFPPEPTYKFDYSHAWGGTPLYSLPQALTGLEILEPGFKRIRLLPTLLSLEYARVEIPTPYGNIVVAQKDGKEPEISVPSGILAEK